MRGIKNKNKNLLLQSTKLIGEVRILRWAMQVGFFYFPRPQRVKERGFESVKNVLRCYVGVLEKRTKVLEKMEAKNKLSLARVLIGDIR